MAKTNLPRGIRNNNPGNIRIGQKWQGLVTKYEQTDPSFDQFIDPTWGIRALAALLVNYQDKYKLNTVRAIIDRWAPPNENDTTSYINLVAKAVQVRPDQPLDLHRYETLRPLVEAIIRHENGPVGPFRTLNTWYDNATIDTGLQRAGIVKPAAVVADKLPVTKETVAATGTGALGVAQIADVAPQIMTVLDGQQEHLTSGSVLRILIGVTTIGLAVVIAYSQIKKHQAGIVA